MWLSQSITQIPTNQFFFVQFLSLSLNLQLYIKRRIKLNSQQTIQSIIQYLFCINVDYLHNTSTDKENLVFKRQVFLYLVFVVNLRFPQLCSNFLSSSWWPAWKHLDKIKKISVSLKEQEVWMSFCTIWGANWRSVRESRVKNRAKLAPDWFSLVNNGMFRHCVS